MTQSESLLLPNLGAEEGDDWRAYQKQPSARVAAHLWSVLFSANATLRAPDPISEQGRGGRAFLDRSIAELWPRVLGQAPSEAAYPWIQPAGSVIPWFMSATLAESVEMPSRLRLVGPSPDVVSRVHDKAFAFEAARELDLIPTALASLTEILSAADLIDPDRVIDRLSAKLAEWPQWTGQRFTLKPRSGSSGRGRVAGAREVDTEALRGALPRLARRGGALFEPWLDRRNDLSVCLHLPECIAPDAPEPLPTLLGSLEMLTTPSGVYRGHCGEIDNRGRVFSGHREDETLRARAAALAGAAQRVGYFGPCGIDAFTYVMDRGAGDRELLRPAVEFNARATMGLVVLGLLRRALPLRRPELELEPGDRRAFLFCLLDGDAARIAQEISDATGALTRPLQLVSPVHEIAAPSPYLFFARDLAPLRKAYRERVGC